MKPTPAPLGRSLPRRPVKHVSPKQSSIFYVREAVTYAARLMRINFVPKGIACYLAAKKFGVPAADVKALAHAQMCATAQKRSNRKRGA